jgi:hypothetical protein
MSTIKVNDVKHIGRQVNMVGGRVIVDGKDVTPEDIRQITIIVEGDIEQLHVDACDKISITGNVGNVAISAGNIECGNILGNARVYSGGITCDSIGNANFD